jgi:two-component system, NarL family, invasion response regulator UvrY
MEKRIRVLFCDDHPLMVTGMIAAMESAGIDVVASVTDPTLIVSEFLRVKPDVIVLDIAYAQSSVNGLDIALEIKKLDEKARIVILSQFESDEFIKDAYRLKCSAFVTKRALISNLTEAIRRAHESKPYFLPDVAERLALLNYGHDESPRATLDDRQFEVFKRVAVGDTVKEICEALKLSPRTIETTIKEMKDKLNCQRNAAITLLAVKYGYIEP